MPSNQNLRRALNQLEATYFFPRISTAPGSVNYAGQRGEDPVASEALTVVSTPTRTTPPRDPQGRFLSPATIAAANSPATPRGTTEHKKEGIRGWFNRVDALSKSTPENTTTQQP